MTAGTLHGALVCAGIAGGALLIVAVGCVVTAVCAVVVAARADDALDTFGVETERAIAQALQVVNDSPYIADLARTSGRFSTAHVPDQLAARRNAKAATR